MMHRRVELNNLIRFKKTENTRKAAVGQRTLMNNISENVVGSKLILINTQTF